MLLLSTKYSNKLTLFKWTRNNLFLFFQSQMVAFSSSCSIKVGNSDWACFPSHSSKTHLMNKRCNLGNRDSDLFSSITFTNSNSSILDSLKIYRNKEWNSKLIVSSVTFTNCNGRVVMLKATWSEAKESEISRKNGLNTWLLLNGKSTTLSGAIQGGNERTWRVSSSGLHQNECSKRE